MEYIFASWKTAIIDTNIENSNIFINDNIETHSDANNEIIHINIDSPLNQSIDTSVNIDEYNTKQFPLKEINDARLIMFSSLYRDIPVSKITELIAACEQLIEQNINKNEIITDIFLIMFEKRDCRNGEKEKKIFYDMFKILSYRYPLICRQLIKIIPEYGCWKDLWIIADETDPETLSIIYETYANQMLKDYNVFDRNEINKLSLSAKWTPTEKTYFHRKLLKTFPLYLKMLFPLAKYPLKNYRKKNTLIRKALNVTEQFMSSNKFSSIDPKKTPFICATHNKKAFLNLKIDSNYSNYIYYDIKLGNRYPNNIDRVKCRQNWLSVNNNNDNLLTLDSIHTDKHEIRSYSLMRIKLDNKRYDMVRQCVKAGINLQNT